MKKKKLPVNVWLSVLEYKIPEDVNLKCVVVMNHGGYCSTIEWIEDIDESYWAWTSDGDKYPYNDTVEYFMIPSKRQITRKQ